jgi:hypothetical protein
MKHRRVGSVLIRFQKPGGNTERQFSIEHVLRTLIRNPDISNFIIDNSRKCGLTWYEPVHNNDLQSLTTT